MKETKLYPPKWSLRFFRWYCHLDYQEDIEGDLMERFEGRLEEEGKGSKVAVHQRYFAAFQAGNHQVNRTKLSL